MLGEAGQMDAATPSRTAYRFIRFTLDPARGGLVADGGADLPLRLLVEHLPKRGCVSAAEVS
jgi:hypothetical protein